MARGVPWLFAEILVLVLFVVVTCALENKCDDVVVFGAVLSLSQSSVSNSVGPASAQGLRFWAEYTNSRGGVLLPDQRKVPVRLVIRDDEGDPELSVQHYKQLAEEEKAHFFLGGAAAASLDDVNEIANRSSIVSMSVGGTSEFPPLTREWLFFNHAAASGYNPQLLLRFGVTKFAFMFSADTQRPALACNSVAQFVRALGLEVVFLRGVLNGRWDENGALQAMAASEPELLWICPSTTQDGAKALRSMANAGITYGWHSLDYTAPSQRLRPEFVQSSTSIKFLMMSGDIAAEGAAEDSLPALAEGWVNNLITPGFWHHELGYSDPFLGGTGEANQLWKSRLDWGGGTDMTPLVAAAIAAATALQLALGSAANMSGSAIADAMRALDTETLYGRLRFDATQRNAAQQLSILQWRCDDDGTCERKIVFPVERGQVQLAQLDAACPQGSLPSFLFGSSTNTTQGCESCISSDRDVISALIDSTPSLRQACPVYAEPIRVAVPWTGGQHAETLAAAVSFAAQLIARDDSILPNVPVELLRPAPNQTSGESNQSAAERLVREISRDGGGLVWSGDAGGAGPSSVMLTWMNYSMPITAPSSVQGQGLARVMLHMKWQRLFLLGGEGEDSEQMRAAFKTEGVALGFEVVEEVVLPKGAGREDALRRLEGLDDCLARVLVLCLDRDDAVAVLQQLDDAGTTSLWLVLGGDGALEAHNKPPGMLGLRPAARSDGTKHAELNLHLQTQHTSTSVVGADASAGSADVVVGDPQDHTPFFAADALLALLIAVWKLLEESAELSSGDAFTSAISRIKFDGASGVVEFDESGRRRTGRFLLTNWDGEVQVELGFWDAEGSGVVIHTLEPSLEQEEWMDTVVLWPTADGNAQTGDAPQDVCECRVWSKMGPHSQLSECSWTAEAVVTVVLGAVVVLGCLLLVGHQIWQWNEEMDWHERQLARQVVKVRRKLRATRADGVLLSSERRWWRVWDKDKRVVQRAHVEAIARLTLFQPFEIRNADAFARNFHADDPFSDDPPGGGGPRLWRLKSFHADKPVGDAQYFELCKLLMSTAQILLQPAAPDSQLQDPAAQSTGTRRSQPLTMSRSNATASVGSAAMGQDDEKPQNAEERFRFLQDYVFKLQIWADRDHALFKVLKSTVVQELMDSLRAQCDQLFTSIQREPGGLALCAFPTEEPSLSTATHTALPPPLISALNSSSPLSGVAADDGRMSPFAALSFQPHQNSHSAGRHGASSAAKRSGPPAPKISSDAIAVMPNGGAELDYSDVEYVEECMEGDEEVRSMGNGETVSHNGGVRALSCEHTAACLCMHARDYRSKGCAADSAGQGTIRQALTRFVLRQSCVRTETTGQETVFRRPRSPSGVRVRVVVSADASPMCRALLSPPALQDNTALVDAVTRQDHPLVHAIRQDDEDVAEASLQREVLHSGEAEAMDEELYIAALYRRALLLNEGFQQTVQREVSRYAGTNLVPVPRPPPTEVVHDRAVSITASLENAQVPRSRSPRRRSSSPMVGVERVQPVPLNQDTAQKTMDKVVAAPVKTKARMQEKLVGYAGGQGGGDKDDTPKDIQRHPLTANILDPIRCSVMCSGPKEMLETARWLLEHGAEVGLPVVRVKNKFALVDSSEYDGYRDLMLCVLFTGDKGLRVIGEVQVHDVRLFQLKLQMHKLYKVKRAAAAAAI